LNIYAPEHKILKMKTKTGYEVGSPTAGSVTYISLAEGERRGEEALYRI